MRTLNYFIIFSVSVLIAFSFITRSVNAQNEPGPGLNTNNLAATSDSVLKIITPNGAENWLIGTQKQIVLNNPNAVLLNIELSTNTGQTWQKIGTTGTNTFDWVVPNTPSPQCKIRVRSNSNPLISAESDNVFNILSVPGIFNVQFDYDLTAMNSDIKNITGVTYIPGLNEFWLVYRGWFNLFRVSKDGTFLGQTAIDGLSGYNVTGLTYDGNYLYATNSNSIIYIVNPLSGGSIKSVVGRIFPTDVPIKYLTYDQTAFAGDGGFWTSYPNNSSLLLNRQGKFIDDPYGLVPFINPQPTGVAFDNYFSNGPYLWLSSNDTKKVFQKSIKNYSETGLEHDLLSDVGSGVANPSNSGLFITTGLVDKTVTIGGILNGDHVHLYGYKLGDVSSSEECPGGLVGYWKLNETSGKQYADAAGSNNADAGTTAPVPVTGKVSGAQQFNGSSTQINVKANPVFDFGPNTNFSIECWVKYTGAIPIPRTEVCIGREIEDNIYWYLGIEVNTGKPVFRLRGGIYNGFTITGNAAITDGLWHHLAFTRYGIGQNKLYVDGIKVSKIGVGFTQGFTSPDAAINIGWLYGDNHYFEGSIDEIAIYNSAMTDFDIKEHYNKGLSGLEYCRNNVPLAAPLITSTPPAAIVLSNDLFTYKVKAAGNPAPTFSLVEFPDGMKLNSTTGEINWTVGSIGNHNVTIEAHNGIDPPSQQSFIIKANSPRCASSFISYWKLDEITGGNYTDVIGNNNAVSSSPPTHVTGMVNGAQQFNGTTTKIDVPGNSAFDLNRNNSFSVELWFNGYSVPTTDKCIVGRYIPAINAKWFVGLNANNGNVKFYMKAGTTSTAVNGPKIADGNWHHVVVTRNGSSGLTNIYVDQELRASGTYKFSVDFSSPTANLNIGWLSASSAYFLNGILDEVAIYNTELPLANIQEHYQDGWAGVAYCTEQLIAPAIISNPVKTGFVNQLYSYKVESTGSPAPNYSLITFPAGMTIDTVTGLIQWSPAAAGNFDVTVEANNGITPPARQSFTIAVSNFQICPASIISYWKFDETELGSFIDYMGNNTTWNLSSASLAAGIVGYARQFDGSGSRVDILANSSFNFGKNSSFTVEFWFKGTTIPTTAKSAVGRYNQNVNAKWFVGLNPNDGKARFYMSAGATSAAVNGTVIVDGNWHHVAATRNGSSGSMKIYVDGVLKGSTSQIFTVDFSSSTANLNIGWLSFQSVYTLNGILDEVAIFNAELSVSDIQQHYNNGLAGLGYCSKPGLGKFNIADENTFVPKVYGLFQNYPNPFNPVTVISYQLPVNNYVELKVYDILGREVTSLVNEEKPAGKYNVTFNASGLSSGIYFYKMQAGQFVSVRKLIILK